MGRQYSREYKEEICRLIMEDGLSPRVVAEQYGLHHVMLYRWMGEKRLYGNEAFVGQGHQRSEDKELRKLKKENERLRQENEILKKAAAYFAKEKGNESSSQNKR